MLSQMAEQERLEYERRKREEEAERKRIEEEEKWVFVAVAVGNRRFNFVIWKDNAELYCVGLFK